MSQEANPSNSITKSWALALAILALHALAGSALTPSKAHGAAPGSEIGQSVPTD